jgi:hypothetical protein
MDVERGRVATGVGFALVTITACVLLGQRLTDSSWPLAHARMPLVAPAALCYFVSFIGWWRLFPPGQRPDQNSLTSLCLAGYRIASGPSRLCRSHRGDSVFVDLDHVASRVCSAREPFEPFRSPRDDRVGVGAGLDRVALFNLLVEEDVEAILARPERVDLSHRREYRKAWLLRGSLRRLDRFRVPAASGCYRDPHGCRWHREIGFSFLLCRRFESLNLEPWQDKE